MKSYGYPTTWMGATALGLMLAAGCAGKSYLVGPQAVNAPPPLQTATATVTPLSTSVNPASSTPTVTSTQAMPFTATPTATAVNTATAVFTATSTAAATYTFTSTFTATPTSTFTSTFTGTPTTTPTGTPTAIPTAWVVQGTFDNFNQEVLQSPLPVLVEFYATWCPHCAVMSPAVLQFAQDYAGQVKVVQVDYDAQPALDSTYGITGLPTCIFFVNGTETEEQAIGSDDTSAEDEAVLIDLFGELP